MEATTMDKKETIIKMIASLSLSIIDCSIGYVADNTLLCLAILMINIVAFYFMFIRKSKKNNTENEVDLCNGHQE
jgi:hypothetical protein